MGTYISVVFAVFITIAAIALAIQRLLTSKLQEENSNLLLKQTISKRRYPLRLIGALSYAFIFVFLAKGVAADHISLAEGCGFGLLMGLAMAIPPWLNQYALCALPPRLLGAQAAVGIIQNLAAGIVVGWLL